MSVTLFSTFAFYSAIAYHKYTIHSYESIYQDLQKEQNALGKYFCDLKRENLIESGDLESDVMLKQYDACLKFHQEPKKVYLKFDF